MNRQISGAVIGIMIWLGSVSQSQAQLNPLGAQFYCNQYLGNPALAGITEGLDLGLNVRRQWSKLPGGPTTQAVTAEYGFERVGVGFNAYNDKAGLLRRTRAMATYAYHLPIAESHQLHFGISMGIMDEGVDEKAVNGDEGDLAVARFNERPMYVDGDLGIAYSGNRWVMQVAVPNVRNYLASEEQNTTVSPSFFAAASYRFPIAGGLLTGAEPKIAYRDFNQRGSLWDVGIKLAFADDAVSVFSLYHSSKNISFGAGGVIKGKLHVYGIYNAQTASTMRNEVGGNFELSINWLLPPRR